MPTIIDSLLVTLGLDSKGFDAGVKKVDKGLKDAGDEAEKTGKKLKTAGEDGAQGFESAAKSAAKFLSVIGGAIAIKQFIQHQIEANAALDRLSKNLNDNVNAVSAWSNAAELAGGSAQGLQNDMSMLSQAQTELQLTGQSSLIPYFSALGMSMADAQGKARPVGDMLLDLSDRFSKMDRTTANNMARMMGLDPGTVQLLVQGRSEVELMIKRQKEFGAVSKQQAEEATRLKRALTEGKQNFEAFGRTLLSYVTPAIETTLRVLGQIGAWVREHREFVVGFFTLIASAITLYYLPAMIRTAIATWAAIAPLLAIVAPIAAVAAALAALWEDYRVWKAGGDSLVDWSKWEPGIQRAIAGINKLKFSVKDLGFYVSTAGDMLSKFWSGDFEGYMAAAKSFLAGPQAASAPSAPQQAATPAPSGPATSDRQRFVNSAAQRLGVNPSIVDAQLRLETGASGSSTIGKFNYGNIKAGKWPGQTASRTVDEYDAAGNLRKESAKFRAYSSPEEAAADYANLINRRYPGAAGADSAESYAAALKAGGYATDPDYVSKIARVARGIPGASQAAAGAGAGRVAASNVSAAGGGGSRSVETTIGEVKVYTQATDAVGIAADMGRSLDYLFTAQANLGLQ